MSCFLSFQDRNQTKRKYLIVIFFQEYEYYIQSWCNLKHHEKYYFYKLLYKQNRILILNKVAEITSCNFSRSSILFFNETLRWNIFKQVFLESLMLFFVAFALFVIASGFSLYENCKFYWEKIFFQILKKLWRGCLDDFIPFFIEV